MSAPKQSLSSRLLRFIKRKTDPGMKGNTIRKIAPEVVTDTVAQQEPTLKSSTDISNFPLEYYTPRPTLKTFVVGDVRRVSNNGSPPDPIRAQHEMADASAATQPEGTVDANLTVETPGQFVDYIAPCQLRYLNGPASDSPTPLMSPAGTNTPSHGVNSERRQRPICDLVLGLQDPTSSYFTRRYFSEPFVADEDNAFVSPKDILHHFCELDPQAFDMYKIYTHTGKVVFKCSLDAETDHIWISCWPLMNAHILGCVIEECTFADRVMDTLSEKLTLAGAPDLETTGHLFDLNSRSTPEVLKAFVVDCFINAQQRSRGILKTSNYPAPFKELALQSALKYLSCNRSTTISTGCEYHTHGKTACYKTRLTLADTLREQRLAEARKISAKDPELVTANVLQNSVKNFVWGQRRASAHQALRIETGQVRASVQRLANGKPMHQTESANSGSRQATGSIIGTKDTDQSLYAHRSFRPMSGTRPTLDLNRAPHNSPMLQARSAEISANDAAVPVVQNNGKISASQPLVTQIEPLIHGSHAFLLAELEDSSVLLRPTRLALKCKPSTDRLRAPEARATSTLVVTNGVGENASDVYNSGDSASPSDQRVGELTTEYENCVNCPGTYPQSNPGV